jgi:hypothetical protein
MINFAFSVVKERRRRAPSPSRLKKTAHGTFIFQSKVELSGRLPSVLFWLRPADRTEQLPLVQEADMASFGAADAFIDRLTANRTPFHA